MGNTRKKGVVVARSSGITVGSGARLHVGVRLRVLGMAAVVLLAVGGVWALCVYRQHVHDQRVVAQHRLQQSIGDVNGLGDTSKLGTDSTGLIQGAASGVYDVSDDNLAKAHAVRGDIELNAGDYKAAVADYTKAVELDSAQKELVAYGQFLARYHLGERKSLVPLLQSLAAPLKDSHNPGAPEQLALYESYVVDLQAGKDLVL